MSKKEKKERKGLVKEFKEFITKGNVLDLAVGVIIGGAFNAIVTALNQHVLMPIINWVLALVFKSENAELVTILPNSVKYDAIKHAGAEPIIVNGKAFYSVNYINWSSVIEAVLNFFFIALTLFIIIKVAKYLSDKRKAFEEKKKQQEVVEEPAKPETPAEPEAPVITEVELLAEIRDLLQENKKTTKAKTTKTKTTK